MAVTLAETALVVNADMRRLKPAVVAGAKAAGDAGGRKLGDGIRDGVDDKRTAAVGRKSGVRFGDQFTTAARDKMKSGFGVALGAVGLGAGIGAGLTAGLTAALNVGQARDKLRAQLDLTAVESGRLGKVAGSLYASNYGGSLGEVNDAISSVVRNIPSLRSASVPVLKDIAAGALDIARVFDQDVAGVTAAVSTMMKSGLAPNAKAAMDLITRGFQTGADKGGDLLDTMTEYSVQFVKLGLDGPTSLGIINQLLAGGARNADVAADAVKEFAIRAIDGSKGTREAYKTLGVDADRMAQAIAKGGPSAKAAFGTIIERLNAIRDPVARETAGVQLFGTKWEDLGGAINSLDVSKATAGMGKLAGATARIADQSTAGRVQSLIRVIQTGFVDIIGGKVIPAVERFAVANREQIAGAMASAARVGREVLLPALKAFAAFLISPVIPTLADVAAKIAGVIGWFREHSTVAKALGVVLLGTYAAMKGYAAGVALATAATKVHTAVTAQNGVVQRLLNSTMVLRVRVWAIDTAAWVRSTAATVAHTVATGASRAAMLASSAATKAHAAATVAWAAITGGATAALAAARAGMLALSAAMRANPIGAVITIITLLVAAVVLAYKKNETFRNIVNAVWASVKTAIKATVDWLVNVAWPFIRRFIDGLVAGFQLMVTRVRDRWNLFKLGIQVVWAALKAAVFDPIRTMITKTIPDAFRSGVNTIGRWWKGLEALARKPVEFVVNSVINPLITGYNKIAGVFNAPTAATIKGFAAGGQIPGAPSVRDNLLAVVKGSGKLLKVAAGEFVTNTRSTLANLPLLNAVNRKQGKVTRDDLDPYLDGRAAGGPIGDGFGDFFGKVWRGVKGAANIVTNPKAALTKLAEATLGRIPGGGLLRGLLSAMGRKLISGVGSFLSGNSGGTIGGGGVAGGWRGMQRLIAGQFPGLGLISGFRPGSRTLSGRQSYHALGRAVDYPPSRALAAWWRSRFGARTKELISPFQDLNLLNGRPHRYTGRVWTQHNFAGGNAHVHIAAMLGGLISRLSGFRPGRGLSGLAKTARADFGSVTLARGMNLIENATGRPEPLRADRGDTDALLRELIAAVQMLAAQFAAEMRGVQAGTLRTARAR